MFPEWLLGALFMAAVVGAFAFVGRIAGRRELADQARERDERITLKQDVATLTTERNYWYAEAQKAERARDAEREARLDAERVRDEARREAHADRAARIEAERAVQDGAKLVQRLDEMQAEIVRLRTELTRATVEIRELRRAGPAT